MNRFAIIFILIFPLTTIFAQQAAFTSVSLNISSGWTVHTADLNGDTWPDIIASSDTPDEIHIFFNDGSGNFNTNADASYPSPNTTRGIDTGDFNEDGLTDIVLGGKTDSVIYVYFGQSDGSFAGRLDINTKQERIYDVAAGDINNDNHLDIVAVSTNNYRLLVIKGNGDGSFQTQAEYSINGTPTEIELADLDGDGFMDVAQGNGGGGWWIRYINDGSGGFPNRTSINSGNPPTYIALKDMDASGSIDLTWGSNSTQTDNLGIHLNAGATVTETGPYTPGSTNVVDICVADFDNDSDLDIFSMDRNGAYISWTDGNGTVTGSDSISDLTNTDPKTADCIDFDKDGRMDVVICHSSQITILYDAGGVSAISETQKTPRTFYLYQNYPNPFNPQTTIRYQLSETSEIKLSVYNMLGQKVATLFEGKKSAGYHRITWNAADNAGGIYFCRLSVGNEQMHIIKLILLK